MRVGSHWKIYSKGNISSADASSLIIRHRIIPAIKGSMNWTLASKVLIVISAY